MNQVSYMEFNVLYDWTDYPFSNFLQEDKYSLKLQKKILSKLFFFIFRKSFVYFVHENLKKMGVKVPIQDIYSLGRLCKQI